MVVHFYYVLIKDLLVASTFISSCEHWEIHLVLLSLDNLFETIFFFPLIDSRQELICYKYPSWFRGPIDYRLTMLDVSSAISFWIETCRSVDLFW